MRHATRGIAASTLAQLVAALLCKEIAARNETDTFFASQLAEDFVIVGKPTSHPTRPPSRVPTSPPISRPTAAPRPPDIKSFRLRLTWKKGYMWQEKSSERFWCMRCKSSSCSKGSGIEIDKCSKNDSRQQFYFDENRIRSKKSHQCVERSGRSIKLNNCSSSSRQKWDGLSSKQPFQLRPRGSNLQCASQHHEPREGEILYMTSCKKSRANKTDLWNVY